VKFHTGHFQIQHPDFWEFKSLDNSISYTEDLIVNLDAANNVEAISPRIESFALASFGTNTKATMVMGIEPEREDKILNLSKKLVEGKMIGSDSKGVVIGQGLAEYLKIGVNDTLVLISQGYHGVNAAGLYKIKGIIKFPNPIQNKQLVVMPLKQAQWFYDMDQRSTSIVVLLSDYMAMPQFEKESSELINSGDKRIIDWQTMSPELVQMVEMKYESAAIMIFILYAVIGFGMFGTFLMMTAERMLEYGIMLAIGMRRFLLQAITFIEILMLSSLGVILGLAISAAIITYIYYNPIELSGTFYEEMADMYGMEMIMRFSAKSLVFTSQAEAIFIIAFILSFYPLIVIHKTKPVEAIREG
ncbi:MAG: ABC transporter permease, partial [Bacteroidota bacterium]